MDPTKVIIGPLVTEKAERLKMARTYTLKVAPTATKIDISKALHRYYDCTVASVRVLTVRPKNRAMGKSTMEKRHSFKKAIVTLTPDSKSLDLSSLRTS